MINGKDDLSRVNYRFQVIAVASANSQFPSGKLALSKFRPHLHTIPAHVSIYHFRQFSATRLRDASQRSGGICRWRFVDYAFPSRTHQVRLRCPRFRRGVCVCFLNNFHRQHSLNVPPPPHVSAHATDRAIHAHAESDRAIISLLSEILKTTETKSMRSYFSYSIHSTDLTSTPISPLISTFLLYFDCLLTSLSVYALALLVKLALGKNAGLIGWFNWFQRVHKNKGICRKYLRIKSSRIDKR